MNTIDIFKELQNNTRLIIKRLKGAQEKLKEQEEEINTLKSEIKNLKDSLMIQKEENDTLKVVNALISKEGKTEDVKSTITQMVRELDECITLLKEQ